MKAFEKAKLIYVFMLVAGCSTFGMKSGNGGRFISQAARVQNELPSHMQIPAPADNQVDDTYMQTKADYHFTLAESYGLQDESAKAVENYKLALIYDQNSPQIHYRLAQEYLKLGLVTEAIAHCKESLKVAPKHKDAALLLGGLLSAMHLYDEALELYQKTLKLHPNDMETSLFIGALHAEKGEFQKAIQHLKKMTKNKAIKDKSQVWYYLGRIYSSIEPPQYAKAEAAYTNSLKVAPDATDVVLALADVYEKQKKTKQLKRLYADYQAEHRSDHVIAERLAQVYLNEDNLEKAVEQLTIVESYDNRNLNISLKIALIMIEQKKFSEAITKLEAIQKRSPESEKVRFYLGALYEETKNYRAAIQQFDTIPFGSTYYIDAVMHSSYLHKLMGNTGDAIATVEKGLGNNKDVAKFWILHASLLDESNKVGEAQKVLLSAIKLFPEDKQIHFQLGSVYDRMGQKDKTVEQMEKVLGLDENHVQALNYLAYLYADSTRNLDEAERLVRKALRLQPGDGFILDTLGWVLFKQNRMAEAIKVLERAFQKESKESVIAEHLGDAYFRSQLPRKAKEMYQKAASLEKDDTKQEKLQSKIQSIELKLQAESQNKHSRQPASLK